MQTKDIEKYILKNFEDVYPLDTWGEKSFFINPNKKLKRGTYFATIKEKDGDNDKSSNLDRDGVYRLNIGVSKELYLSMFNLIPKRPSKGQMIEGDYNFQELNAILPHPVYGWMSWVCILNPSKETFNNTVTDLLHNAYAKAHDITIKKISKNCL